MAPDMEKLSVQRDGINPNAPDATEQLYPGRSVQMRGGSHSIQQDSKEFGAGDHTEEKNEQKGQRQE